MIVFTVATLIMVALSAQANKRGLSDKTGMGTDLNNSLRWQMLPDII